MSEFVTTAIPEHSGCNGITADSGKKACDMAENLPNGLHSIAKEKILQKEPDKLKTAVANEEVVDCEESARNAVETQDCDSNASTNKLIDKFSTELTMSLINALSTEAAGELDNAGGSVKLADVTTKDSSIKTEDAAVAVDSTVDFPISKSPTNSDYLVGEKDGIRYLRYENETQMSAIMQLITKDLSEPYSIYTYRYFIHNWPHLCFLAMHNEKHVGAIVCKLDLHKKLSRRGYIAMLAIDKSVRRRNIGTTLVKLAIETMHAEGCDEVVLETEVTNKPALKLYENLGFVRDKRLFRYYLNGVDALRLKLWLR